MIFLAFFVRFPFFPKDSKGLAEREILSFFKGSLLLCPKQLDWRVRVTWPLGPLNSVLHPCWAE